LASSSTFSRIRESLFALGGSESRSSSLMSRLSSGSNRPSLMIARLTTRSGNILFVWAAEAHRADMVDLAGCWLMVYQMDSRQRVGLAKRDAPQGSLMKGARWTLIRRLKNLSKQKYEQASLATEIALFFDEACRNSRRRLS